MAMAVKAGFPTNRWMVDFHTHVLPQMDDGSRDVQQSLLMLSALREQGVGCVIATPHYYPHRETPETFLDRRDRAEQQLRSAMENQMFPELRVGAEVRYYEGFGHTRMLERLKIHGSNLLLLEMPFVCWNDRMLGEIRFAQENLNCTVVLAHIERYLRYQRDPQLWEKLGQMQVLIQASAAAFLSLSTRGKTLRMLQTGKIHLLGSDCHDLSKRPPNLGTALDVIERRLGEEPLERLHQLHHRMLK